jgi:hypothetical protein
VGIPIYLRESLKSPKWLIPKVAQPHRSNLLLSFLGYVPSVPATGGGGDDGLTWYQYWFWWWAGHAHEEGKLYAMESRLGHTRFRLCKKSSTALASSFSHCHGSSSLPPYGCHPPSIAQRTQARICFIFHYYGHFLFHALLNLQLPLARREEEVWPLNPYITKSTSSNQCPDTRALILCIVCRIFHPSNLVSLCIMVVPIFSWDHSHIQKRACGMREGIVVGG